MATVTAPAQTFQPGITRLTAKNPGASIQNFALSIDASQWILPGSLDARVEVSFDNGVTWQEVAAIFQNNPPPWLTRTGTTSTLMLRAGWGTAVIPTDIAITVNVGGTNPMTLGPSTLTVS